MNNRLSANEARGMIESSIMWRHHEVLGVEVYDDGSFGFMTNFEGKCFTGFYNPVDGFEMMEGLLDI
jgi:hypothetical protein